MWTLVAITLIGFGIRVFYILDDRAPLVHKHAATCSQELQGDAIFYHCGAQLLADGKGFINPFDYDLLCIGSGPAGQRGAVQAAKLGKRVALIERRGTLGGACVDTGTIPSKTFREAVLWTRGAHARASAMIPARPTAAELLDRVAMVVARERSSVRVRDLRRVPPNEEGAA